ENVGYPTYMQNAYEFLEQPGAAGEWYLDHTAGMLYYVPLAGQNVQNSQVVAPTLQTLLQGVGTLAAPIHNVQFQGLTFEYAGWLGPTTQGGFVDFQATWNYNSSDQLVRTPADVVFEAAQSIVIQGDTFTHFGGAGLDLYGGSQNDSIIDNTFADLG